MRIIFYNHYHNGDLVLSKEFVREFILNHKNYNFVYAHSKHPKVLLDLPCEHIPIENFNLPQRLKFLRSGEDTFFINTWIGAYTNQGILDEKPYGLEFNPIDLNLDGINWKCYHRIWEYINSIFNQVFHTNFELSKDVEDYAHEIDYSKFNCNTIEKISNSVLISNGLVESGQTHINNDMSAIIKTIAHLNPSINFICTKPFETDKCNIIFTNDIIKDSDGCDLNEIAYLSNHCDIIIGRNSGPFLFTNTKENMNNPNKKFLVFGKDYHNCSPAFLDFPCYFKFVEDVSETVIMNSIKDILPK